MIKKLYNKIKNNLNDAQFITVDYIRKCKRIQNTRNPKTFSEKIHFIKKLVLIKHFEIINLIIKKKE